MHGYAILYSVISFNFISFLNFCKDYMINIDSLIKSGQLMHADTQTSSKMIQLYQ